MEKINMNNQSNYFDVLPDYLVENMIFPYLTSKELFFFVRSVSSEWNEMMKKAEKTIEENKGVLKEAAKTATDVLKSN